MRVLGAKAVLASLAAVAALTTGCDRYESYFAAHMESPVAVGAVVLGRLESATIRTIAGRTAREERVATVRTSAVEPADAFERVQTAQFGNGGITYRALKEGTATFTFEGDDGNERKTFTETSTAMAVTRMTGSAECAPPLLFPTKFKFRVTLQFFNGDTSLVARDLQPLPVRAENATIVDASVTTAPQLETGDQPGAGKLVGLLDPSFSLPFTVFSLAQVQSLQVSDVPKLRPLGSTSVSFPITVDGGKPCREELVREIRISTPDICHMRLPPPSPLEQGAVATELASKGTVRQTIYGLKSGTCTVTATLQGTSLTVSKDIPVSL